MKFDSKNKLILLEDEEKSIIKRKELVLYLDGLEFPEPIDDLSLEKEVLLFLVFKKNQDWFKAVRVLTKNIPDKYERKLSIVSSGDDYLYSFLVGEYPKNEFPIQVHVYIPKKKIKPGKIINFFSFLSSEEIRIDKNIPEKDLQMT